MRLFLIKSLFFILLLSLLYGLGELQSRNMYNYHTDLGLQWNFYLQRARSVEQVILGHSHCDKGIDPSYLKPESFNLAFSSQDPYYDLQVFRKVLKKSPNLRSVIICFTEFTLANDESHYALHLVKDYEIIMGINPRKDLGSQYMFKKSSLYLHRNSFIKDFTQGKKKSEYLVFEEGMKASKDQPILQKNGHRISQGSMSGIELKSHAKERTFKDRTQFYSLQPIKENTKFFKELIAIANKRGISVYLVSPPRSVFYNREINSDLVRELNKINMSILNDLNLKLIDGRSLWSDRSEYFFDSDHLNTIGAEKFSRWLSAQIDN